MDKQAYKKIMSRLRRKRLQEQYNGHYDLINILINLKSYGVLIYSGENRRQLLWVLRGNKTWVGDVLSYFRKEYNYMPNMPYPFPKKTGTYHMSSEEQKALLEVLPF